MEKEKEESFGEGKLMVTPTDRPGEYRAIDLQLWNSGKNERLYQNNEIWLTMKFNRFCKQRPWIEFMSNVA